MSEPKVKDIDWPQITQITQITQIKRLFEIGWLLADMPGLRYSPVQKKFA
jgi:hypothetical protein